MIIDKQMLFKKLIPPNLFMSIQAPEDPFWDRISDHRVALQVPWQQHNVPEILLGMELTRRGIAFLRGVGHEGQNSHLRVLELR